MEATRKIAWRGSFQNRLMENSASEPVVDGPATLISYSDRHPAYVKEILKNGIVHVQELNYKAAKKDAPFGSNDWEFFKFEDEDTMGRKRYFKKNKFGTWDEVRLNKETNRWVKVQNGGVRFGVCEKYHDYSF